MWSGSIASIPSGWLLCDGTNSTPDLRNRFIIGANADDSGVAKTNVTGSATQTGGSKDAIVVSHTHTATTTATDSGHTHSTTGTEVISRGSGGLGFVAVTGSSTTGTGTANITASTTVSSTGSSGTNANLVPYYALAYIMKS